MILTRKYLPLLDLKNLARARLNSQRSAWQYELDQLEVNDPLNQKIMQPKTNKLQDPRRSIRYCGYTAARGVINDDYHTIDIVKYIRELLDRKSNEQIRVLELGAGNCVGTKQLREVFQAEIESGRLRIFSTGLVKAKAKSTVSEQRQLHKDDLKWRSIQELRDFPEFDLIYSTWGETSYIVDDSATADLALANLINHIALVIRKLKPYGYATLSPILRTDLIFRSTPKSSDLQRFSQELEYRLSREFEDKPVKIQVLESSFFGNSEIAITKLPTSS